MTVNESKDQKSYAQTSVKPKKEDDIEEDKVTSLDEKSSFCRKMASLIHCCKKC